MVKQTIVVLFAASCDENDKSLLLAYQLASHINSDKYFSIPLGITEEGFWLMYQGNAANIVSGEWKKFATPAVLSPDVFHKGILKISGDRVKMIPVDIILSTLAGSPEKNAALAGIAKLSEIPFRIVDEECVGYTAEQMREYIERVTDHKAQKEE